MACDRYSPLMSDLPAVPLIVVLRDGTVGGATGCFVDVAGTTFLVTAAHVPAGGVPATDWDGWHPELTIFLEHRPSVPLFATDANGLKPRFLFMRSSTDPTVLVDVLATPCHPADVGLDGIQVHSVYSSGVHPGQTVTLHGYPLSVGNQWPLLSTLSGPLLTDDNALLVADLGATGGFSGGPVTGPDGCFLGVVSGTGRPGLDDDFDRILVPGLIHALPQLVDGNVPSEGSFPMFPTAPTA